MNTLYKIVSLIFFSFTIGFAQNIEFEESNFPGKKDQWPEVKEIFKDGKYAFEIGKKEYDLMLENYVMENIYYPASRKDYQRAGNVYFKQALPLLLKAQTFNPNNAYLNYMLGTTCFNLNPQSDSAIKFFEKAIALKAKIPTDVNYFLGWAYQFQLNWDEAIKYYKLNLNSLKSNFAANELAIEDINKKINECKVGKKEMASPKRIFVDNLGENINSPYPEYSAYISADESMMLLTARRENTTGGKTDENDKWPFEDLYQTFKVNGKWTKAKNLGEVINTADHDASSGLSGDGSTMFIFKYKEKDGGDIYSSNLLGETWTKPEHLNKNVNSKRHESSVSLSYDGKRLYFVSDRDGTIGDRDIYYSDKDPKGEWGKAVNAGPILNTKYGEDGVFIHPDGKTIYFSSKGHNTMGGYDIFKSVFEKGRWSEPENLGYPINGPDDDVFFVISASGNHGYFASSKQGGYGDKDIYKITFLGPEKPPLVMNEDNLLASVTAPITEFKAEKLVTNGPKMTILKGVITDAKTNQPLEATIELIDNSLNEVIATFKSNSTTGKYLVSLPSGKNYGIFVKKDGYLFHSENFDLKSSDEYQEVEKNVALKQIEVGQSIVLKNIFFDFDKASLRSESMNELNQLVKLLTDNPTLKIELGSHTDSKGSDEYNQKLSQSRSQSVVSYLITKQILADRLVPKGYGETVPVATNETEAGRQENRRTEFKILSK